jgi:tRNA threonylcarbamoyladenosine biosynthesis protein TsaB
VNVLAIDTATPATVAGLAWGEGQLAEARDDLLDGARPRHAQRILPLAAQLLERAPLDWSALEEIAVGVGPGGYTGLRLGLATARGLARAHGARLVGVGTLAALAEPVTGRPAAAVLDARRGEAFVAVYRDGEELAPPAVCAPEELAERVRLLAQDALAVGDGALRFGSLLEAGGIAVAPADSALHLVSGAAICRLALGGRVTAAVPDYLRIADAERARQARETR